MRDVNVALTDLGDPVTHASSLYGNFFLLILRISKYTRETDV